MAPDTAPRLWTIGYERHRPESLVAELEAAGVERVLDVRLRPSSRKPGMSKTKLGLTLEAAGIAYEHRRALGTPPDLRSAFRAGRHEAARAAYAEHLLAHEPQALEELAGDVEEGPPTALLCLEHEPAGCHRTALADLLRERLPGLTVVEL